jgi:hypothetical protein
MAVHPIDGGGFAFDPDPSRGSLLNNDEKQRKPAMSHGRNLKEARISCPAIRNRKLFNALLLRKAVAQFLERRSSG